MIVYLEPWEYVHAHDVGIRRAVANWNVADKSSYTMGNNQPEIIASPAAAIAELAVAKALNRYWSGHVWDNRDHVNYRDLPDVEPNLEVRRIRAKHANAKGSVWRKDYGKDKILVYTFPIPPEYRQVEILGWVEADLAWEKGEAVTGRRVFSLSNLKDIGRL